MAAVIALCRRLLDVAASLRWLGPLLVRLVFGYFWLETGWAKLQNLDAFTERFVGWGIPFPAASAALSAWTELLGGALLMLGLCTRWACIPLIVNMVVAVALVVIVDVGTLDQFVELDEVLYILVFIWLLLAGPGRVSLDHWLAGRLGLPRYD
ncbi:DoxX family protein [Dokdonella koreensis]|uniref:DoxX family protein n=1 Tax=Dokdonella koreensis DS-123 TaxID=1300342 RepID=A0A161HIP1_9GAMM|nr:DoxX family protein [Dokdonella koreensis]ANB16280.1 DoxX family protein [Dokdonella koreensis DS-123]